MAPTLAVTLGDPRGIGPEVTRRALAPFLLEHPEVRVLTFGPPGEDTEVAGVTHVPVDGWDGSAAGAGRVSVGALQDAVARALAGEIHAVVTGPVHKPALHEAGFRVPGQTELLQDLTGAPGVGMLMAAERTRIGPPLRVLLATTHTALRNVPDRVTTDLLVEQVSLLAESLRGGWGIPRPRIGLCALNPHASDRGLFGDEEAHVFEPAVAHLVAAGIDVAGPIPADTVFRRALSGDFDAVVAPYHDVGMAAFKTVSFGEGVNVTLGLPFVRTSPDHGTAFDLAGTNTADPSSMHAALRLAARLARARFDTTIRGF